MYLRNSTGDILTVNCPSIIWIYSTGQLLRGEVGIWGSAVPSWYRLLVEYVIITSFPVSKWRGCKGVLNSLNNFFRLIIYIYIYNTCLDRYSSNSLHICNSNKLLEQNLCKHSSNTHFVYELLFGLDFKSIP